MPLARLPPKIARIQPGFVYFIFFNLYFLFLHADLFWYGRWWLGFWEVPPLPRSQKNGLLHRWTALGCHVCPPFVFFFFSPRNSRENWVTFNLHREGEGVCIHCHCLQHFSLVWVHGWEGCSFIFRVYSRGLIDYERNHDVSIFCRSCCYRCGIFFVFPWNGSDLMPRLWRFCGQHLIMNVFEWFLCLYSSMMSLFKNAAECQPVFLKSPLWHRLLLALTARQVRRRCTTRNEGSLHASMKFNLRRQWMTEKSCRLWFILMKLCSKTGPHHGRARRAATQFLITYKLRKVSGVP